MTCRWGGWWWLRSRWRGGSKSEVARSYGVTRQWVHELVRRYEAEGEAGLEPRIRFEADQPNEMWQADTTHWELPRGIKAEILKILDDHSRLLVASDAHPTTKGGDVLHSFNEGFALHGFPASVLTDNAAVFTGAPRGGGRCALEIALGALGIRSIHSSPYHPQTCGKVERFHQTQKKWLRSQPPAQSITELQVQLDWFRGYYNEERPHRALGRRTPEQAFEARPQAGPSGAGFVVPSHFRVRRDRVDKVGRVTLRYNSRLHHIGLGTTHRGKRVLILVADLDIRVITEEGELLRELVLDPTRDYQGLGGRW